MRIYTALTHFSKKMQSSTIQGQTQNQNRAIFFALTLISKHWSSEENNSRNMYNMNARLLAFIIQYKGISHPCVVL